MNKLQYQLGELNACLSAREFFKHANIATVSEAWMTCKQGQWMLYLIAAIIPDDQRPRLVAAACRIARRVCVDMESPPAAALAATEAWAAHPSRHNRDIATKAYELADRFHMDMDEEATRENDAAYACVCAGQLVAEPSSFFGAYTADDLVTATARASETISAEFADEIRFQFSPKEIEGWMPV